MDRSQTGYKSYKEKFFELTHNHWVDNKQDQVLLRRDINRLVGLDTDFGTNIPEETLCYIWYNRYLKVIDKEKNA